MATFWTFSGINSYSPSAGRFVDYVGEELRGKVTPSPRRRYASRLGTSAHYTGDTNVLSIRSGKILDDEAVAMVDGRVHYAAIPRGLFRHKQVRCLLVAPKTTTPPPETPALVIEIYWNPMDGVPNQSIFRPDSKRSWRKYLRGGGHFWAVRNSQGSGMGKGHAFPGFMVPNPKTMKRASKPRPGGGSRRMYYWKTASKRAPSAVDTLNTWLADPAVDYVFAAHSQGTNILTHLLRRGFQ